MRFDNTIFKCTLLHLAVVHILASCGSGGTNTDNVSLTQYRLSEVSYDIRLVSFNRDGETETVIPVRETYHYADDNEIQTVELYEDGIAKGRHEYHNESAGTFDYKAFVYRFKCEEPSPTDSGIQVFKGFCDDMLYEESKERYSYEVQFMDFEEYATWSNIGGTWGESGTLPDAPTMADSPFWTPELRFTNLDTPPSTPAPYTPLPTTLDDSNTFTVFDAGTSPYVREVNDDGYLVSSVLRREKTFSDFAFPDYSDISASYLMHSDENLLDTMVKEEKRVTNSDQTVQNSFTATFQYSYPSKTSASVSITETANGKVLSELSKYAVYEQAPCGEITTERSKKMVPSDFPVCIER